MYSYIIPNILSLSVEELTREYSYKTIDLLKTRNFDTLWKAFAEFHPKELALYFLPEAYKQTLDFEQIVFLNKEKQHLIRQYLGKEKDQKFLDKLMLIPFKNKPQKKLSLHIEFQTEADSSFTKRMAEYMILRSTDNEDEAYTLAIISRSAGSYCNKFVLGKEDNGITFRFADHIIFDQPESYYEKPTCLVSQCLHSVWLKEHQTQFGLDVLEKKFLKIAENIQSLDLYGTKYTSAMLFIQKNALDCLSDQGRFNNFVEKVLNLNPNFNCMNIFEEFKREGVTEGIEIGRAEGKEEGRAEGKAEGRAEGKEEGRAEGKAEGRVEEKTKMVKMLAKDLNLPIRQIARLVSMPTRQVKTILAAI